MNMLNLNLWISDEISGQLRTKGYIGVLGICPLSNICFLPLHKVVISLYATHDVGTTISRSFYCSFLLQRKCINMAYVLGPFG